MSLDRSTLVSDAPAPPPAPPAGLAETALSGQGAVIGDTRPSNRDGTDPDLRGRIGRFVLLDQLGSGGMGVVYAAFDPELDRRIAVKLLRRDRSRDYSETRFLREAQAMARLSHPNVVHVYDVGVVAGQVFIAMELVTGEAASEWLAARPRGWREILDLYLQAGRGLAAAHAAGIVHRDFKPDNVLIGADGRARVADFGLARGGAGDGEGPGDAARATVRSSNDLLDASLTFAGAVMGTPAYMSPEQHVGKPAGPASDQFSFCVAVYEALCGVRPFDGDTLAALTDNVLAGRVMPPATSSRAPKWIVAILRRGLQPRAADRYPDMDALLRALERDPAALRRRWFAGLATTGLATALGWSLSSGAAAEVCAGGAAEIAAVWGEPQREAVAAALRVVPAAAEAAPRVLAALDAYAARWAEAHRDVCLAHQRGERSSRVLDAGIRCLAQRRAALASAAEVLAAGGPPVALEAASVASRLPAIAFCADPIAMAAEVPPPDEPATATSVEELRADLARVRVLADAGELARATAEARDVRDAAGRLNYPPLAAEAALAEGRAALLAHDVGRAREALDEALVVGLASRVDAVAAEAGARLVFVDGVGLGRTDEALARRRLVEALVERTGGRRDLQALLANNLGAVHHARGEHEAARGLFQAAVDAVDGDPYVDPVERHSYRINLAIETADPAARAALFAEAVAGLGHVLGDSHLHTLHARLKAADHTLDPAAARDLYREVCPALVRDDTYVGCVLCFLALGRAEDDLDRPADAVAALGQAAECLARPLHADDVAPMAELRDLARGHAALLAGDPGSAVLSLQTAIDSAAAHQELPWIALRIADMRVALGRALLALGRDDEAIAALEQAIAALAERAAADFASQPHLQLARARTVLAEALTRGLARDHLPPGTSPEAARARVAALLDAAQELYRRAGEGGAVRVRQLDALRPR